MKFKKNNYDKASRAAQALDEELSWKSDHIVEVGVDLKSGSPALYVEIDNMCDKNLIPKIFKGFKTEVRLSTTAHFACACF